jgi:two-component system phosphate regulon response regulator PhoB
VTKKKILVVDDDPVHLLCARELLEAEGYEVQVYGRGLGATEQVMHALPHLVLLDVNMPGLSGEGLARVIRNRPIIGEIPVVLYSSNDEDQLRSASERLGLAGWVCKGDPEGLRRTVTSVIGGP